MSDSVTSQDLMRYLDGELTPDERVRIESALADSATLREDLAKFRSLRSGFHELSFTETSPRDSVWHGVAAHVCKPSSRVFVLSGLAAWVAYGAYVFAVGAYDFWERLGVAAVAIGILALFAAVIRDRYQAWSGDD